MLFIFHLEILDSEIQTWKALIVFREQQWAKLVDVQVLHHIGCTWPIKTCLSQKSLLSKHDPSKHGSLSFYYEAMFRSSLTAYDERTKTAWPVASRKGVIC